MPLWQWAADAVGGVLLLVLLFGLGVVVRRRLLGRAGGTFEINFRDEAAVASRGWVLGLGRYTEDVLECFRIFSLAPRPTRRLGRSGLSYLGQRLPVGTEVHALYAGHVVATCATPSGTVELAMSPDALTGFLAWLEAAPPGRRLVM